MLFFVATILAASSSAANAVQCSTPCVDDSSKCCPQPAQKVCEGYTRGDCKCNHDRTRRVCAKIGNKDTTFFKFTGQADLELNKPGWKGLGWCGTEGSYSGNKGGDVRCPEDNPTWCICKWATDTWIQVHGKCDDSIEIDCPASDICATELGLFFSYYDSGLRLGHARECMKIKCADQWRQCVLANPRYEEIHDVEPCFAVGARILAHRAQTGWRIPGCAHRQAFRPQSKETLQIAVDECIEMSPIGYCSKGSHGPIGDWDVSAVISMGNMFAHLDSFNQDLSNWDVSAVSDTRYMFYDASAFNQDLSKWDVSKVIDMSYMFSGATAFNQDLSKWDVSAVTNMCFMFSSASAFKHELCGAAWVNSKADRTDMFVNSPGWISSAACITARHSYDKVFAPHSNVDLQNAVMDCVRQ